MLAMSWLNINVRCEALGVIRPTNHLSPDLPTWKILRWIYATRGSCYT